MDADDRRPSRADLLGLGLLALWPRIANLGSFSMWLDEVIETQQASGSLAQTWLELRRDVVHPPLEGLLTWVLLRLGWGETARRLVPVALGVATVLLLARWTGRRFGRRAGLATGAFAALAPLHVHYSQELRPYSLALFLVVLSVVLFERLLERPTKLRTAFFALAAAGCLYALYFAVLVLVPVGALALEAARGGEPEARRRARRWLALSPLFFAGLALAYLPWMPTVFALREQRIQRAATRWTLPLAAERWRELTVGGGPELAWAAALAFLLGALGAVRAARTPGGRALLAAALAGTLGVELALHAAGHWSDVRYDLVGWPFLAALVGCGVAALARLPAGRALAAAAVVALAAAELRGIGLDYRSRQDWRRVAEAVDALRRPGEPVFALNQSTRIPLLYYLREIRGESADPPWLASVDGSHRRLAALWPADRCALLVLRNRGRQGRVRDLSKEFPLLADYPASEARIRLLTPEVRDRMYRNGRTALGPAAPPRQRTCDRELPEALRHSRSERPFAPLLGRLGMR